MRMSSWDAVKIDWKFHTPPAKWNVRILSFGLLVVALGQNNILNVGPCKLGSSPGHQSIHSNPRSSSRLFAIAIGFSDSGGSPVSALAIAHNSQEPLEMV